ncbi:hypothetical protein ORI60_39900 [Lentzea sp. NEAU-D7]|nr:hypothetical protein [Lentzea sp. NEAU-D7]
MNREFHRLKPNELRITDITQHRTREGWLYSTAGRDAFSRRFVGWPIDSAQDSTLVGKALDMAIRNRRPEPGGTVHAITKPSSPPGSSAKNPLGRSAAIMATEPS